MFMKATLGRLSGQRGVGNCAAGSGLEYEMTRRQQSRRESADSVDDVSCTEGITVPLRPGIFSRKSCSIVLSVDVKNLAFVSFC
jgi:hypothetical protein